MIIDVFPASKWWHKLKQMGSYSSVECRAVTGAGRARGGGGREQLPQRNFDMLVIGQSVLEKQSDAIGRMRAVSRLLRHSHTLVPLAFTLLYVHKIAAPENWLRVVTLTFRLFIADVLTYVFNTEAKIDDRIILTFMNGNFGLQRPLFLRRSTICLQFR
jgi:hypothetical protein